MPYQIRIKYSKEYNESKAKWKLEFAIAQYDKYVSVYPSKGNLKIDDFEINYESVMTSKVGKDRTLFVYGTLEKINDAEIIKKLANAKLIKFTAIGHDKQEFVWSPKIIEEAKKTLEYFDMLKTSTPVF